MADNIETVLAEEAQEEALLARTESIEETQFTWSKNKVRTTTREPSQDTSSETNALLSHEDSVRRRYGLQQAGDSYNHDARKPWQGAYHEDQLPWHKRPSLYWLLPAFFPFCVAFGGMIVPRTYLVLNSICNSYLADEAAKNPNFHYLPVIFGQAENPQCRIPAVQRRVSLFNTYSDLLSGIFAAIVTPHLGALSDRVGRKKIIVIASFGGMAAEIMYIIVGRNPDHVSIYWLLLGSLADGLGGSFTAGMALIFAYASDCTPPDRRAVAFGRLQATLFAGVALGPIFAGWLISITHTVLPVFYVTLGCHIFFVLFITLFVPESLSKERKAIAQDKHAELMAKTPGASFIQHLRAYNIFEPIWVLWPTGPGSSPALRRNLVVLAAIDTMMFGVAMGTMRIILIYAEYRFGWDAVQSSIYVSITSISRVSFLVFLLPLLKWMFRGTPQGSSSKGSDRLEITIIRISIIFDLIGYLGLALTPSGPIMILAAVIASVGGIGSPTLQSSITKHMPPDRTGQILGAVGTLHALARVVAPTVFNLIYGFTVQYYAGIVFLCLASVFVIVFILSWFLKTNLYLEEDVTSDNDTHEARRTEPSSAS